MSKKKKLPWREYRKAVETPFLRVMRHISFWLFLLLYLALLYFLYRVGVWFYHYCEESFILYEGGQIDLALEKSLRELNEADALTLRSLLDSEAPQVTSFDDGESLLMEQYVTLSEKELTAKERHGVTTDGHSYTLLADGAPVGEFRIVSVGQELRLGLLQVDEWAYDGGSVEFSYEPHDYTFVVPEGFQILVNGIALDESYRTGEEELPKVFSVVDAYHHMPRLQEYRIEGIIRTPQIQILDNLGNPVEAELSDGAIRLDCLWSESEPDDAHRELAISMAQLWANYTLRDAEWDQLRVILIPNSTLWTQVNDSRWDRRYIDAHTLIGYENVAVTEFVSYGEDCFSCRVTMDRTVKVDKTQQLVTDNFDMRFYFVRLPVSGEPNWFIADMQGV